MTIGVSIADPAAEERIRSALAATEELLKKSSDHADPLIAEAARHLLLAGGKRFRPLLTLLAAELGSGANEETIKAAAVMELTHLATLYHDDVMDDAPVRRGAPSANSRWDNSVAILVGDYLFAQASMLVSELGPEAVRIQAQTFARLVTGQIRETTGPQNNDAVEHHLEVLADKTGSLIAASALMGAKFAGADEVTQKLMSEYGELVGLAFQLADDIIDITSDSSGKTPGTDLREGVPTLPVLLAMKSAAPEDARLRDLISRPLSDEAEVQEALGLLRAHPALAEAQKFVKAKADEAKALLAGLPMSPARTALEGLCNTVINRIV